MVSGNRNMVAAIEFPLITTAPSGWFVTAMEPLACNDIAGNSISLAGNSDSLQVMMNVFVPNAASEQGIIMYPNPVTDGWIHVQGDGTSPVQVSISDAAGRQFLQTVLNGTSGRVDVGSLGSRIYLVSLRWSSGFTTQKLTIH